MNKNLNAGQEDERNILYLVRKTISLFGYFFGVIFLLLGVYVYVFYQTSWIGQFGLAFGRYQNSAIPIIIVGVALLVIGFIAGLRIVKKIKM